ncbi:MAG TPA: carboxypeptidase regulatory-like domain-containing protein [Thermoanaerobaculia bacterium]
MRVRALVLGLVIALLWALPAITQGNPNGKLSGRVTAGDQPLPGVKVTVSSPNLQGTKSTVTSSTGDYLFPSLPPGEYELTFEAQGLQTVKQVLRIGAAQSSTLDTEMAAAAVTEEIVVTGSLETISQTVQSATTYTKQLVDALPTGRTVNEIVALSPGVQPNGPAKNTTTGLGSITISGAPTYENLFLINGVVANENIRGQAFDLFIEDAVQETTTASAGVSAEYGRFTGGVVNVLTKSGGNAFSGSLRDTLTNQSWGAKTPLTTTQTDKVNPVYEATLGGPIMKDRLWFFLAGRDLSLDQTLNTNITNTPYPSGEDQQRYEGKLTASITPSHTLVGSYLKVKDKQLGNSFQAILDLASVYDREVPQEQYSGNYTGVLTENLVATAQYSKRKFTFIGSGAPSTDLIAGTLLLDRSRGNARYHSPTFCGVCGPELRNNENWLGKLSYFLSTEKTGSHDIVGGVDSFNDQRLANNHQSGSDYRVFGTSAILRGADIFPVFANDGSTIIQFNPIAKLSQGTNFKTNSAYINDNWRFSDRMTFGVGLRYDANDGTDEEGKKVAKDSNFSPRLSMTYDVHGDSRWIGHASYGQYVAAIANSVGDASSAAGAPATFQWAYRGPAINTDPSAPLLTQDQAIRALFDWFQANGGPNGPLPLIGVNIPGGNTIIRGSLDSPSVTEYALGLSARLGEHGIARADVIHRDWHDFYAARTDLSTGHVTTPNGPSDLTLVENNDSLYERRYDALQMQFRYSPTARLDLGGNWTLSHTQGNFDGETRANGPVTGSLGQYPEYHNNSWASPKGDLLTDQRHRVTLYGLYNLFSGGRQALSVSLAQSYFSGHPYDAPGSVTLINPATGQNYVSNPGYVTPPVRTTYYFSKRGSFTTPSVLRTDLSLNYDFKFSGVNFFVQPQIVNLLNGHHVDTTDNTLFDTSIFTADNRGPCRNSPTGRCLAFNPLTEKPVEGVNWQKGPNFGKAVNQFGFQTPRTFRVTFGLRF